jgi:hypothetical protein
MPMFLVSCNDSNTDEIRHIIKEWTGKVIVFPAIEPIYIHKTDTTCTKGNLHEYKIVNYTDSTGCTTCKLRMDIWMSYIKETGFQVDFLFYFHPKNTRNLLLALNKEHFINYPIYIDHNGQFNKLNKLPANPMGQCFLLDKNNKVLAIGNPANNPKIWELYKKIITGKVSDKAPTTTVEASQTEIELKNLKAGKTSEAVFVLKNTGTKPLVIQMVDASCGCTVPEWEKQPIGAGKSTEIRVKITPGSTKYFNKTVTVHCNTEENRITVHIRGTVNE